MYLVRALSGNYLYATGKNPTWTSHAQLALKFKSMEFAQSVSEQMGDFWGVACVVEPWFNDRTQWSKASKPFSSGHGNFEYTL